MEAYRSNRKVEKSNELPMDDHYESLTEASQALGSYVVELQHKIRLNRDNQGFPQLERYAARNVTVVGEMKVCNFCGVELDEEEFSWHFEEDHYDQFLQWLDLQSHRRRRRKLCRHRVKQSCS